MMGIPAEGIADVIAFDVSRPQRVALNEILVRPTAQAMWAGRGDALRLREDRTVRSCCMHRT